MGGSSSKQVVGYKYYLGVHMALAHGPLDNINKIEVDRRVAWEGLSTGGTITVSAESLFGGDKREGGVSGAVDIEMGESTQLQNSYLQSILGTDIPAFRGVACAVLNQCYMGNNPYLKPWAFQAKRTLIRSDGTEQWYPDAADIARAGDTSVPFCSYACDAISTALQLYGENVWPMDDPQVTAQVPAQWRSTKGGLTLTNSQNVGSAWVLGGGGVASWSVNSTLVSDLALCDNDAPYVKQFYSGSNNSALGGFNTTESLGAHWLSYIVTDTEALGVTHDVDANFLFLRGGGDVVIAFNPRLTINRDAVNDEFEFIASLSGGNPSVSIPWDSSTEVHVITIRVFDFVWVDQLNGRFALQMTYGIKVDGEDEQLLTIDGSEVVANGVQLSSYNWYRVSRGGSASWLGIAMNFNNDPHDDLWQAVRSNHLSFDAAAEGFDCAGACPDMNPAHIIRESLTDDSWGMGYGDADIDDASFTAAADTLFAEGMGISILWEREQPLEDFIGEILRHIDAVLYVSRSTGQFVLKLIREETPTLTLDESNVASVSNAKRPTISELTNAVSVVYWDAQTDEDASTILHNEALRQVQGVDISTTIQYPGFSNREVANRVAERDLRALSTPLLSCEVVASRAAADLNTGDPFTLDWPDLNINSVTMRANEIDYGDGEDNSIRIVAVQDVFTTPSVTSQGDLDEVWIDPTEILPLEARARLVTETPYYPLVVEVGEREATDILTDDPDAGFLLVSGGRAGTELNANVLVDAGTGYEDSATLDFHPYAQLTADISETTTALTIDGGKDLDLVETGTIAQIDDEMVRIDAIDVGAGTVTVGRGILDTTPRPHLDDAFILFWDEFAISDDEQYAAAESIDVKLTPSQSGNTLSEADAPADSVTFNSRAIRPYPPGNLQVDAASYPDPNTWGGDHTFTWAHRDRLQQTDGNLFDHTTGDIGPEAGTTYRVDAFAYNASEVETQFVDVTLASVTTWTYDAALVLSDPNVSDPPVDAVRLVFNFYSVRDGYDSFQPARVIFTV